jgi:putative phage-type endonuclease
MELIKLEQGSEAWLDYRYEQRNASEAGTVMGVNPYQTPYELRVEKTTKMSSFKGNIATDYGNVWEANARKVVADLLMMDLEPAVYREGAYSASLDAYGVKDNESVKVEIKCPFQRKKSKLWSQVKIDNASWDQCVPETYLWQIVHQDFVCPTTRTYFFVYIPAKQGEKEDWDLIECFPNDVQKDELVAAWDDFFENPPPPDLAPVKDKHLIAQMAELRKFKGQLDILKNNIAEIESELKNKAKDKDTVYPDGSTIKWGSRIGAVDNKKIYADYSVNVDKYRKTPSRFQTIKIKEQI